MTTYLIAGLGSIGRRHLRNLIALGEKDVVLLRSHRSTLPEDDLKDFPVETDLHRALGKYKPAAVIVATPSALHFDIALPAAEAGCSILLEKPISASLEGVDRLQTTIKRSGSNVLVGFQLRFHPCLVHAHELISSGGLGRIMSAHANFSEYLPAWHPWEDYRQGYAARADLGGGVLLTQCHSLDYLPWLAGEVESVWGILAKVSDLVIDVEDTVEIGLRFTSGATGSLHLDFARQPPSHHIEISGTRGFMECDLVQGVLRLYQAENGEWQEFHLPDQWERNVMFLDEMKHFIDVVRGDAVPLCKLEDGIRVMQIISAIRASDSEQRLIRLRS